MLQVWWMDVFLVVLDTSEIECVVLGIDVESLLLYVREIAKIYIISSVDTFNQIDGGIRNLDDFVIEDSRERNYGLSWEEEIARRNSSLSRTSQPGVERKLLLEMEGPCLQKLRPDLEVEFELELEPDIGEAQQRWKMHGPDSEVGFELELEIAEAQ